MKRYKLACNFGLGDVIVQTIVWVALSLVTFGLALPFFVYWFIKLFIDHTEILEIPASGDPKREPLRFMEFPPEEEGAAR